MALYNYIDATGTITPDTSTLLADVENEFKEALGQDLIVTSDTPQGMLIAGEVAARSAVIANNATLANQINPNLAGGVFFDAIWALTAGFRASQQYSNTPCDLAGVPGTVIPVGVTARNANGDIFASLGAVTLDGDGNASVTFQALIPGPIAAPANTITQIVNGPLGWETITNPADATLGAVTQSDLSARVERRQTLFLQGSGALQAILAAIYATPNVNSAQGRENIAASTVTIDGVSMVAHSVYLCVSGGTDLAIASTCILGKKSGGCGWNNGPGIPVSVAYTAPYSGQLFNILFDRPNLKPVLIKITVSLNGSVENIQEAVTQAILDFANGLLFAGVGFTVGSSVSCFELAGAVTYEVPGIFVHNVETKLVGGSFSNAEIPIAIYEQATITPSSIDVVII